MVPRPRGRPAPGRCGGGPPAAAQSQFGTRSRGRRSTVQGASAQRRMIATRSGMCSLRASGVGAPAPPAAGAAARAPLPERGPEDDTAARRRAARAPRVALSVTGATAAGRHRRGGVEQPRPSPGPDAAASATAVGGERPGAPGAGRRGGRPGARATLPARGGRARTSAAGVLRPRSVRPPSVPEGGAASVLRAGAVLARARAARSGATRDRPRPPRARSTPWTGPPAPRR
jgi:hypothetical protein